MRLLRALLMMNTVVTERKVRWQEPFHLHRLVARAKNRSWMRHLSLAFLLCFGLYCGAVLLSHFPGRHWNVPLDGLALAITAYVALATACMFVLVERFNPHTICITERGIWIDGPGLLVKKTKIVKLTLFKFSEMPFLRITYQSRESIVGIPGDLPTDKLAETLNELGYQIESDSSSENSFQKFRSPK
jgi:hypothetical protein